MSAESKPATPAKVAIDALKEIAADQVVEPSTRVEAARTLLNATIAGVGAHT
jgi:hypothetical protein